MNFLRGNQSIIGENIPLPDTEGDNSNSFALTF